MKENSKLLILIFFLILIGTINAQLADSPWPMFKGNPQHTGLSTYNTSHVNGTLKWSFQTGDMIESSPAIGPDGTIYVGSHDNKLYAVNPDGTEKWHFTVGDPIYLEEWDNYKGIVSSPAVSSDGTIYFASLSDFLFAVNPDGSEKWRVSIPITQDTWTSPAIGSDGTIYIGSARKYSEEPEGDVSAGGRLYALNPDGTEKWNFLVGGDISSSPAVAKDGTIYFGAYPGPDVGGRVYAISPSGREKWHVDTDKWIESSITIGSDGTIYTGSYEGKVYAISSSGIIKWSFQTGDGISSVPSIGSDGTIYFGSWDYYVYALNPDGTEKWRFFTVEAVEGVTSSPAIGSDGTIYVGSNGGNFYAINPDGTEKWKFDNTGGGITSSPAIGEDGTIYVGGTDSKLYAFGGAGEVLVESEENQSEINETAQSSEALLGLADSPWPKFRGNLENTGLSPYDSNHVNGTVKWSFETGAGIESSPAIGADGTIYVGSNDNKLYAINPDGTMKWSFSAGAPVYNEEWDIWKGIPSSPAIASDGTIYISSFSNFLFAINPDGSEKWRVPLAVSVDAWSSPTIGPDGTIYIGSAKDPNDNPGKVYAINPDGSEKWGFETESDVFPTAAIASDGTIYSGCGASGKLYAINPDGSEKWHFQTGKHIESSATIGNGGTIYVGSWDDNFYAINPDGSEKWSFATLGEGIPSSPAIASDGTIYLSADDGYLYAINPEGNEKWAFWFGEAGETTSSPAIGADGTIYVGSNDNKLYAINPDGTMKWSFKSTGGFSSPAIGSDGTVYVGSWNHKLYAFGGPDAEEAPANDTLGDGEVADDAPENGEEEGTPEDNTNTCLSWAVAIAVLGIIAVGVKTIFITR